MEIGQSVVVKVPSEKSIRTGKITKFNASSVWVERKSKESRQYGTYRHKISDILNIVDDVLTVPKGQYELIVISCEASQVICTDVVVEMFALAKSGFDSTEFDYVELPIVVNVDCEVDSTINRVKMPNFVGGNLLINLSEDCRFKPPSYVGGKIQTNDHLLSLLPSKCKFISGNWKFLPNPMQTLFRNKLYLVQNGCKETARI